MSLYSRLNGAINLAALRIGKLLIFKRFYVRDSVSRRGFNSSNFHEISKFSKLMGRKIDRLMSGLIFTFERSVVNIYLVKLEISYRFELADSEKIIL